MLPITRLICILRDGKDGHVLRRDAQPVGTEAFVVGQRIAEHRHLIAGADHTAQILGGAEAEVECLHLGADVHTEIINRKTHVGVPPLLQ